MEAAPAGAPAGRVRRPRAVRLATLVAAACAAVLTSSCAAGEHAQTAEEKPTPQDFTFANLGTMQLRNVALRSPDTVVSGAQSYPPGASVPMTLVLVNIGTKSDTLQDVRSPVFDSWGVFSSSAVPTPTTSASTASPSSSPSTLEVSSASTPASPSSPPPSFGTPSARTVQVPRATTVTLGAVTLAGSNTRVVGTPSMQTAVLAGLRKDLFPGMTVPVTFSFRRAGSIRLQVPVQLTAPAPGLSIPSLETLPNGG